MVSGPIYKQNRQYKVIAETIQYKFRVFVLKLLKNKYLQESSLLFLNIAQN